MTLAGGIGATSKLIVLANTDGTAVGINKRLLLTMNFLQHFLSTISLFGHCLFDSDSAMFDLRLLLVL